MAQELASYGIPEALQHDDLNDGQVFFLDDRPLLLVEISVLFADIRGFTSISEGKLPYDVVFLLNRYFRATGQAIASAGRQASRPTATSTSSGSSSTPSTVSASICASPTRQPWPVPWTAQRLLVTSGTG